MVIHMNVLYGIKVNGFYKLVERVLFEIKFPLRFSTFSKKMYGNFVHVFLLVYKEKLNVSYRRFVKICDENSLQRMLCIKRIPHFTTLQKFLQKIEKNIFEKMVQACHKLLNLKNMEASIDGTGFSNTNPSHYYLKRCSTQEHPVEVKNYTKTLFITDNNSKLILNIKTFSDNTAETTQLKQMVSEIKDYLAVLLADKGYDSASNRKHCRENGIKVHIPLRKYSQTRREQAQVSKRVIEQRLFDDIAYTRRVLIEAVNSAIKQTLGGFVRARTSKNQQKQVTIKAIAYNVEHIERTIKIWLFITTKGFLHRRFC